MELNKRNSQYTLFCNNWKDIVLNICGQQNKLRQVQAKEKWHHLQRIL